MPELTPDRIVSLTNRQRVPAQIRQLQALGIRYGQRADGSLVVLDEEVRRVLYGGESRMPAKEPEPDWEAV